MATYYSPKAIMEGLQLCLDGSNGKSYISGSSTWYDVSGNNNHATFTGVPTISNGKVQLTDGSVYGTFSQISLSGIPFTVMAWIYKNNTNDFSIIGGGAGGGNANSHYIIRSSKVYFGNYGCDMQGATTINANTWYHVAYLMDTSQKQSVFVNGVLDGGPSTTCGYYSSYISYVGYSCCGGNGSGIIDHLLVYNRALSYDEIAYTYNITKKRYIQ